MSDQVEAIGAVETTQQLGGSVALHQISEAQAALPISEVSESSATEGVLDLALWQPNANQGAVSAYGQFSGAESSAISDAKQEIVSDVSREGAVDQSENSDVRDLSTAERFAALFHDLTKYHMIWSIAQKTQQDINHILRGQ